MEYAIIKLISGDELIAGIEEHHDHITVFDPVQVVRHMTRWGPQIGVTDWLMFVPQKSININRDKIVAFKVGLEDNAVTQYLQYVHDDRDNHSRVQDNIEESVDRLVEDMELMFEAANTTIH